MKSFLKTYCRIQYWRRLNLINVCYNIPAVWTITQTLSFSDGSTSEISASVIQAIPFQARNYHKSVSENKEIVKLVSVLSTSISSTKKVHAIEAYNMYKIG